MANIDEKIRIEGWQTGLLSDASASDIGEDAATTAENCDFTSAGKLKKSRGCKSFGLPALPTGFIEDSFFEMHISVPESKDVMVRSGIQSGRRRFLATPWYDDSAQTWNTTAHLELTEALITTVSIKNSATSYDLAAATGLSAQDNGHNRWYVSFYDPATPTIARGEDYVLTYTAANRRIVTKYGVAGTLANDKVLLVRFPVFKLSGSVVTPHYQIDSLPTFTQHGESLYIYTGSHAIDNGPDLWFGFIGTAAARQGYYNDLDLDFRGFHFDHANPFQLPEAWIGSTADVNETENPLPFVSANDRWIFKATWLLDGFQESIIFFDETTFFFNSVSLADATTKKTINVSIPFVFYPRFDTWPTTSTSGYSSMFSRRIKRILLYVARGQTGTPNSRPTTPFFLWKDLDVDSSDWAGSSPYTMSLTLSGIEWDVAQKLPYEINTGHGIENLGANARQGLQAGGFYVIGPIYADQEYKDTFVIAPLSGTLVGKNTMPNVIPLSLWVRCREQGIYEIVTMTELQGRLLVFGANTMAVVELIESTVLTGRIVEQFQKRGIISDRGVQVIDGVAYYCGRESLYAFDGSQVRDIGDRIKSDWNNISLANRQACFTGFNRRLKQFFVKAGSTLFVYSTLQDNWKTEILDKTWTYFGIGVDGEFLGTDGTDIFQLDATGYTVSRALHWKSKHFDSNRIKPRRFRASYKGSDLITARIYDEERSSNVPVETILLLPETTEKHVNMPISFESTRISIDLQSVSSINDDTEIDYVSLAETAKTQR